jgi:TadE-like protein
MAQPKRKSISLLSSNQSGVSAVEFGILAPVMFTLLMGSMDVGHNYYVRTVLDGTMQTVARTSSLDAGTLLAEQQRIDAFITQQMETVAPGVTVSPLRRYYKTFAEAALQKPEEFTDEAPFDGICNNGEDFIDINENGVWDEDGGNDGQGGARDVVIIKTTISYPRLFPIGGFIGVSDTVTLDSHSILANQPYGEQSQYTVVSSLECS